MRFDLVTHKPYALFSTIAKHLRGQAEIEANDAIDRQTAKRLDSRSLAAAEIKNDGSIAEEHDSRESAKADGVNIVRDQGYGERGYPPYHVRVGATRKSDSVSKVHNDCRRSLWRSIAYHSLAIVAPTSHIDACYDRGAPLFF